MFEYPTHVEYEGTTYPINTDFRVALQCFEVMEDESISDLERVIGVITLLFGTEIPITNEVLGKARYFLQIGEETEEHENRPPVIDFEQDKALIYSAFLSQYNIRLKDESIHWWEFMELLGAIDPDTPLGKVIGIRALDLNDIKDNEMRKHYAELKKSVAIKEEPDEELDTFMQQLYG